MGLNTNVISIYYKNYNNRDTFIQYEYIITSAKKTKFNKANSSELKKKRTLRKISYRIIGFEANEFT